MSKSLKEDQKKREEEVAAIRERINQKRFSCPTCQELKSEIELIHTPVDVRCQKCGYIMHKNDF